MIVETKDVELYYGKKQVLREICFAAPEKKVTALIGPSGCGKSSFLRCLNRMNDRIPGFRMNGEIKVNGINPYAKGTDLLKLRREVGMLFQKPNPFASTIYDNIALAPRLHYGLKGEKLDEVIEDSLRKAALWHEVKDEFRKKSALELSGGQQQRLCLARMLAVQPQILLMDEPCSALDPIASAKVEELIVELSREYTVLIVTHNLQQAHRVSDVTAFFMLGELIELGPTNPMFEGPDQKMTQDYLQGRFG
ncbi:MAG: phosphate ABC transporter ATP-binding protein PstB [Fimbriimonadaceae bacterium]